MLTKLMIPFTISVIASIIIIGGMIASPNAYSDKNNNDVLDECKCEKPHTLKVLFTAPSTGDYKVEIFKTLDDKNNEEKLLDSFFVTHDEIFMVLASNFGKDKLESNTAFVFYKVVEDQDDELVALMEIHTSCSKPLFIGQTVFDVNDPSNGYSLEVKDGLAGMDPVFTSIPIAEPLTCEDKKSKSTGSITIKKALTNDNGGAASVGDFTITVTNVETADPFDLVSTDDPSISTRDIPAGTYKLSETGLPGYTTVLIAGDTGCPSMVDEVFTIKKGKTLSCTIYNDDNGDGSGGPGGIVFQNNSMQILIGEPTTLDSCDNVDQDGNNQPSPCVEIIDGATIAIVDPVLGVNTRTIVLFSVVEDLLDSDGAATSECDLVRLVSHSAPFLGANNPTDNTAVVLACSSIDSQKVINVNYVMINPLSVT